MASPFKNIGGLWIKDGKKGKFLNGVITLGDETELTIMVFPNKAKRKDNHPDYVIMIPPPREGGDSVPPKEDEPKDKPKAKAKKGQPEDEDVTTVYYKDEHGNDVVDEVPF